MDDWWISSAVLIITLLTGLCSKLGLNLVKMAVGVYCLLFFFQAEDGIRDYKVTGVQTCALPISHCPRPQGDDEFHGRRRTAVRGPAAGQLERAAAGTAARRDRRTRASRPRRREEIGRASCRERV